MTRMSSDNCRRFPVLSEEPSSSCKLLSLIFCERDVFPLSTKTRSVFLKFPRSITDWIGFGLGWFRKIGHVVLLQKTVERAFPLDVVQL